MPDSTPCPECARTFTTPGGLTRHRRYAHGIIRTQCEAPGCERPAQRKPLCVMHDSRRKRWGELEDEARYIKYAPAIDRFVRRFTPTESGCWEWTGGLSHDRYGVFAPDGRQVRAHRWAYEWFVGAIPEGYHIDHLCSNTVCVNPDHLEPVTPAENTRRWVERKPGPMEKEIPWSASSRLSF